MIFIKHNFVDFVVYKSDIADINKLYPFLLVFFISFISGLFHYNSIAIS